MADIFKIGMEIALTGNAMAGLLKLSQHLTGMHGDVDKLNEKFKGFSKAVFGAGAMIAGSGILVGLKNVADHGDELLDQQDKMVRNGIKLNDVLKIQANYYDNVAKAIPTSTGANYLKTVNELRAVTGSTEGAEALAGRALKVDALLSNMTGKKSEGEYYKLLRSAEMKGISTDPAKLQQFTDAAFSYIAAFGGKLSANDYQLIARRGGTAFMNADIGKALGPISVMAADLGGSGAGTTLMTLQQLQTGATTLSKQQAQVFAQLGLLDMSKTKATGFGGGRLQLAPGAMTGSMNHMGDLPGWIKDVVYPAIMKAANGDEALAQSMIAKISPNRNAAKLIEMFGNPHFLDQQQKDLGLAGQVKPIDEAYQNFTANNPKGVKQAYNEQYDSMMQAIGAPLMQAAIPVMKSVQEFFTAVGEFANAHPDVIKGIGVALAGVAAALVAIGGALVIAGGISLVAALGPEVGIAAALTAVGAVVSTALVAFPKLRDEISSTFDNIVKSIQDVISKIASAVSELVNAIMAIPAKIAEVANSIRSHLPAPLGGGNGSGAGSNGAKAGDIIGRASRSSIPNPPSGGFEKRGDIYMDGSKVGAIVGRNIVASNRTYNGASGHDGRAQWQMPDYAFG